MKRFIFGILVFLSSLAMSMALAGPMDPLDIRVVQNNSNIPSNGTLTRYLKFDGTDCVFFLNNSTGLPDCAKLGNGVAVVSGYLTSTQADWNAISGPSSIVNRPNLATVALTADYNDLVNKPALFSGAYADLSGKPDLFSGAYADLTGKPSLFSGAYADLTGKPTLATVATSGSYTDLTNKPTIPTVPVINRAAVVTASDGTYTWTLPTACSTGQQPVVSITPEAATTDAYNPVVTSRSNTSVSVAATSLTILHLIAICP